MALEAPLRSSTGSILSSLSSHSDMSAPSPGASHFQQSFRPASSGPTEHSTLRPSSAAAARSSPSPYQFMNPSDIVGPSPVTSVGTEGTEIEDEASEEALSPQIPAPSLELRPKLRTHIPEYLRQNANEEAVSVIHAPESFQSWATSDTPSKLSESPSELSSGRPTSSEALMTSTPNNRASKAKSMGLPTPPPLSTDVKPIRYSLDSATPRAQNLQEVLSETSRLRSSSASSLELIPEIREPETDVEPDLENYDDDEYYSPPIHVEVQEDVAIQSLHSALRECWLLCNTLANLSTHHRERVFSISGTPDGHEKAWKCCWKLCQRLYDNRDDIDESFNAKVNLDLCRDFCQALFDVRPRQDEVADSILRVSFELNNHLYSAQDNRNLPEAFQERTLDFYITLCHRLMKQRGQLAEETDSLLRACWSLAEMLFSLRQNRRNAKEPDEELLGSAVQACWELCDIFRMGWTQIRPERGTPRPSQPDFFSYNVNRAIDVDGRGSRQSNRGMRDNQKRDSTEKLRKQPPIPETPVTEFEDTPMSPESQSPQVPNIMVLGTDSNRGGRWSSSASNLSSYSQSSQRTSSTATTTAAGEDGNITRIKALILKAAMNVGFSRDTTTDAHGNIISLQAFVNSLPAGSFGSLPWHASLFQQYRNLVGGDFSFRQSSSLPSRGKRVSATDMAKSVNYMTQRSSQHLFLRDLFKLVYGFHVEDTDSRKNVSIVV